MLISFTKELKIKIIATVCLILILSIITLYSLGSKGKLYLKQLLFFFFGLLFLLVSKNVYFLFLKNKFFYLIFLLIFILNIIVVFLGVKKAWFDLGFLHFQPIEFLKIFFIFILVRNLAYQEEIKRLDQFLKYLILILIFSFLSYLQNDLGSFLIFLSIWFFLIFYYLDFRIKIFLVFLIFLFSIIFWFFLAKDYQKERILNFLYPERDIFSTGYNAFESKITFSSGGLWGKGFKNAPQSIYGFLPSAPTDFILAAYVEHFGYVGFLILIFLYVYFWLKLNSLIFFLKDTKEILFLKGFKIWIFTQFTINTLMNLGLLPIVGVPLPFFSYGGSHILTEIFALKIILDFCKD